LFIYLALPNEVDSAATAAATIAAAALASRQQQHQQQQHYQNINQNLQNSGSAFVSLAYASLMPFNQFQSFPLTSNNYVGQPLTTSNLTMESSGIHHQNLHHSNPIEFPSAAVLPNGHSTTMTRFPQLGIQSDVNLQPSCPLNFTYNSPTAYINSTGTLTSVGNYLNTTIPNLINLTPSGTIQALLPNLTYNILTNLNDQRNQPLHTHQSQQTIGQQSLQQQQQQHHQQQQQNQSLPSIQLDALGQIHSPSNLLNFNPNQKIPNIQPNDVTTTPIHLTDTSPTMWLLPAKIPRSFNCIIHHSTNTPLVSYVLVETIPPETDIPGIRLAVYAKYFGSVGHQQQPTMGENKRDSSGGRNQEEALEVDRTHIKETVSQDKPSLGILKAKGEVETDRYEKNEQQLYRTRK
uniref:NDT80 domain-containing protein n=1 Tax=Schistosoma curassoni TaxID=6186 RepID=A0A183KGY4_9TREM